MKNIKFQEQVTNGDKKTTLKWDKVTDKNDLLVEIFTREELFEELGSYWRDLERRSSAKVCMSYEWASLWWQHFGKNEQRSLYIITFWDGTKLVGVAPFYKGYSKFSGSTLEIRLQLIGSGGSPNEQVGYTSDRGISNFLDILVDQSYTEVVANRLQDVLTPEFLGVDVVKFHHVCDTSFIMKHLYPRLEGSRSRISLKKLKNSPYIDLARQKILTDYIKDSKSNGHSRNFGSVAEESDRQITIKDVTTSWEAVEKATDNMIELHQTQRKQLGFPDLFDDKRFTRFFRDILKTAYEKDRLWFKQAFDEDGLFASRMAIKYNNCYYDYIGQVSEFWQLSKNRSPSMSLLVDLIEDAINSDIDRIESLRSEEIVKYDFISGNFKNWQLTVPFKTKQFNIFLFLNRIRAFIYKYFI